MDADRTLRCREFLERHSDFLDGLMTDAESGPWEAHRAFCVSCARYDRTLREGLRLLGQLPPVEPGEDFVPRLEHRLFHVRDDLARAQARSAGGGVAALLVAGAMVLVAVTPVAWKSVRNVAVTQPMAESVAQPAARQGRSPRPFAVTRPPVAFATSAVREPVVPSQASNIWSMLLAPLGPALDPYPPGPYSPLVVGSPVFEDARSFQPITTSLATLD